MTVPGRTLREVVEALEALHPDLKGWLREPDGERLRPGLAAAVDNVLSGLQQPVAEASEVQFLPALRGG